MRDPVYDVSREQLTIARAYIERYYNQRTPDKYEESNEAGRSLCYSFLSVLQHAGELALVLRPDIDTPMEEAAKKLTAHALENVAGAHAETGFTGRYDVPPDGWWRLCWTCEVC